MGHGGFEGTGDFSRVLVQVDGEGDTVVAQATLNSDHYHIARLHALQTQHYAVVGGRVVMAVFVLQRAHLFHVGRNL